MLCVMMTHSIEHTRRAVTISRAIAIELHYKSNAPRLFRFPELGPIAQNIHAHARAITLSRDHLVLLKHRCTGGAIVNQCRNSTNVTYMCSYVRKRSVEFFNGRAYNFQSSLCRRLREKSENLSLDRCNKYFLSNFFTPAAWAVLNRMGLWCACSFVVSYDGATAGINPSTAS